MEQSLRRQRHCVLVGVIESRAMLKEFGFALGDSTGLVINASMAKDQSGTTSGARIIRRVEDYVAEKKAGAVAMELFQRASNDFGLVLQFIPGDASVLPPVISTNASSAISMAAKGVNSGVIGLEPGKTWCRRCAFKTRAPDGRAGPGQGEA